MLPKEALDFYKTKEKIAAELSISVQTFINWEKANKIPKLAQLAIQTLSKGKLKANE